jgi:hypothetical protein
VLFMGARGSGELGPGDYGWNSSKDDDGLGGVVNTVHARILADLANDFTMKTEPVKYNASSALTTLPRAPHLYFNGLATGVSWTLYELQVAAKACPDQQIILSGYSQGAMVMHRVLHQLGNTKDGRAILARVVDAVLVGDGDQVPYDNYVRFDTAGPGADGLGHRYTNWSHTTGQRFSKSVGSRVLEVCARYDPVCDSTWWDLNPLYIAIHLAYTNSRPVLAAADYAAENILGQVS